MDKQQDEFSRPGGGNQCKRSPLSCVLPDGHRGDCRNTNGGVTGGGAGAPTGFVAPDRGAE